MVLAFAIRVAAGGFVPSVGAMFPLQPVRPNVFHMRASRAGIPIDVLHEYVGGAATFQVRIVGDANWIDSTGEWTYGRFVIRSIAYNVEK